MISRASYLRVPQGSLVEAAARRFYARAPVNKLLATNPSNNKPRFRSTPRKAVSTTDVEVQELPQQQQQPHSINPSSWMAQMNAFQPAAGQSISASTIPGPRTIRELLQRPAIAVGRQLEMMNVMFGFEQANQYVMYDPSTGTPIGYIMEEQQSLVNALLRQVFRTHRAVNATVLSLQGDVLLKLRRPFQFINSRLYVSDADDNVLGEVHQRWHLLRRCYDLFVGERQFSEIDAPFLSWDFSAVDEDHRVLATVNKNFNGFAREIFTDTSQYIVRMDATAGLDEQRREHHGRSMTAEERAVMLGCAVSIDFDYFSRSGGHGMFMWLPFGMGGGSDE